MDGTEKDLFCSNLQVGDCWAVDVGLAPNPNHMIIQLEKYCNYIVIRMEECRHSVEQHKRFPTQQTEEVDTLLVNQSSHNGFPERSENNKFMVWNVLWTMPKRKNCRRAMFAYKMNNSTIFVSNEKTCGQHNQPMLSWRTTRSIKIQRVTTSYVISSSVNGMQSSVNGVQDSQIQINIIYIKIKEKIMELKYFMVGLISVVTMVNSVMVRPKQGLVTESNTIFARLRKVVLGEFTRRREERVSGFLRVSEKMRVLSFHLILALPGKLWSALGAPSNLHDRDSTLLQPFDFPIHDLNWFFHEVEFFVDLGLF
ncbi:hypothetical protein LXL04_003618 [Taraxacum kok-saghyz]